MNAGVLADLDWLACDLVVADRADWNAAPAAALRSHAEALGLAGGDSFRTVRANQTHGDAVAVLTADHALLARTDWADLLLPRTDAMILCVPYRLGAVVTADCVPILVADTRHQWVALVHAGWRGTLARILQKTIRRMMVLGSDAKELRVWIGPCICQNHYEVDTELAARFAREFPETPEAVYGRLLNLTAINSAQARAMTIAGEHIAAANHCVFEDHPFPSYRRDGHQAGRILTRAVIRKG